MTSALAIACFVTLIVIFVLSHFERRKGVVSVSYHLVGLLLAIMVALAVVKIFGGR